VSLADQQTAIDSFNAAILAWGPKGNRGSHNAHLNLIDARNLVEDNLNNLNDYVDGIASRVGSVISLAGYGGQR